MGKSKDDGQQLERVKLDRLIPYARNSRTHSDEQVAQIAASIREFGFTNPVLIDSKDGIIAGHGRVLAARKLGLEDVPCLRLGHLTDAQRRAYVIADNKLAINSGWDYTMLAVELSDLKGMDFDLDLLGFGNTELNTLIGEQLRPPRLDGATDAESEWEGMPGFQQGDAKSVRRVIVHFASEADCEAFFGMIDQPFTPKTQSIWFPQQVRMDTDAVRYAHGEAEE